MSGETTRMQNKQGFGGHVVLPQAVSDPSIIDSVAGFIHEVVPQAYSGVLQGGESRDTILWARFEFCDYNDSENFPLANCESESDTVPPLLLVLGYGTGAQVWSIPASGDATELLSWSQGSVRTFRILKRPRDENDPFASKRPLAAIVDNATSGPQFCTVNFVSLRTGEIVKNIKFKTPICDILCNRKSIVITFLEKIAVFDVVTFEDRLTITTCYPSPGVCPNPVALGQRWLAYAEKRLTTWQRSSGGCEGDGAQSYTATAIHAVKSLGKGLRDLSGSFTGNVSPPVNNNASQPGIVTIIDIETKPSKERDAENIIAHFVAHVGPIVAMAFDSSGMLLITADKHGHRFHVFRIHPHPVASQLAAVHHLYILHRGETTARVQDIVVSWDSRWVAVSSVRGTTHVFPITPYGGPVTVRTHTTPNVVNKLSRFEKSAGLSDGRGSPLLPEVPSQPLTPRLPPYPHPTTLNPLAQLRRSPLPSGEDSPLAAFFASPRAWLPSSPAPPRSPRKAQPVVDSLFIISSTATVIQYDLEPRCLPGVPKDKISYDTGIELGVEAKAEWCLLKPPYSSIVQPPLGLNNPLLAVTKLAKPQRPLSTPGPTDDYWLSQVEIVTHSGPHRRLWMGPQFSFKSIDPVPLGTDTDSPNDNVNAIKSNPVNMPHRPYLLIEGGGSAGSIDAPHLAGYSSSTEDIAHGETRLREDLADAMLETAHQTGIVGGGRMKAAALERQVNPLGTVITLPSEDGTVAASPPMIEPPLVAPTVSTSTSSSTMTLIPGSVGSGGGGETVFSFPGIETIECFLSGGGDEISKEVEERVESVLGVVDDVSVSESLSETLTAVHVSKEPSDEEVVSVRPPSPEICNEEVPVVVEEPTKRSKKKTKKKKQEVVEEKKEHPPVESPPLPNETDKEESDFMKLLEQNSSWKARLNSRSSHRSPPSNHPPVSPPPPPPPPPPPLPSMLPPASPVRPSRRERSKRIKMSDVSVLSEKKKSPSPEKGEIKETPTPFKEDSDSSDEAVAKHEKPETSDTPPKLKTKSKSEGTLDIEKSDYETCSEKKSDSSIESFPETRRASAQRTCAVKSWSNIVKDTSSSGASSKGAGTNEDRDSVYESCNDEECPTGTQNLQSEHQTTLPETTAELDESSSGGSRGPTAESSSSNTEERAEEETGTSPVVVVKKVRKQKKKWR